MAGFDVNVDPDTDLIRAIREKDICVVRTLLENNGVNVNESRSGVTALMVAAEETDDDTSDTKIIKALLKHKDIDVNRCDNDGRSALFHAKSVSAMNIIVDSGCDVNITDNQNKTIFHCVIEQDFHVRQYLDVLLKDNRIIPNLHICDNRGLTPLDMYMIKMCPRAHLFRISEEDETVIRKLATKESIDASAKTLALAVSYCPYEICQYLLDLSGKAQSALDGNETALHVAIRLNSYRKCQLLMQYNPGLEEEWRALTPLQYGIVCGCNVQILALISERLEWSIIERDLKKCCFYGESVLECSTRLGIKTWIRHFQKFNSSDSEGAVLNSDQIFPALPSTSVTISPMQTEDERSSHSERQINPLQTVKDCRGIFKQGESEKCVETLIHFVKELSKNMSTLPGASSFVFKPVIAGSINEKTKTYFPDEIDIICEFTCLNDPDIAFTCVCEMIPKCELHVPKHSQWYKWSYEGKLLPAKLAEAFYNFIAQALDKMVRLKTRYDSLYYSRYSLILKDKISLLRLLWRGDSFRDKIISIDLVPAIAAPRSQNFPPVCPLPVEEEQPHVVIKCTRHRHEQDLGVEGCTDFSRSLSHCEKALLERLPKTIIDGYILAKATRIDSICRAPESLLPEQSIRTEDIITSYYLKNCLLNLMYDEALRTNESMSAFHWAHKIYEALQQSLEQGDMSMWYIPFLYANVFKPENCRDSVDDPCCLNRKVMMVMVKAIRKWMQDNKEELITISF